MKLKINFQKHVHFPEKEEMVAIIFIIEDDEFIKEYRNKYWEIFAIDRNRFQHRIQKLSNVLNHILTPSHREKIYTERFKTDCKVEKNYDLGIDLNSDSDRDQPVDIKINKFKKLNIKKNTNIDDENTCESGFEQTEDSESDQDRVNSSEQDNKNSSNINFNESVNLRITVSETKIKFFKPN
jgi:hypothetical protein